MVWYFQLSIPPLACTCTQKVQPQLETFRNQRPGKRGQFGLNWAEGKPGAPVSPLISEEPERSR